MLFFSVIHFSAFSTLVRVLHLFPFFFLRCTTRLIYGFKHTPFTITCTNNHFIYSNFCVLFSLFLLFFYPFSSLWILQVFRVKLKHHTALQFGIKTVKREKKKKKQTRGNKKKYIKSECSWTHRKDKRRKIYATKNNRNKTGRYSTHNLQTYNRPSPY